MKKLDRFLDIYKFILAILIVLIATACSSCKKLGSNQISVDEDNQKLTVSHAPNSITRNIKLDKDGNLWMASWEGIFKYDGQVFENLTKNINLGRFFSLLQDSKGNFWFGSIGSGVYFYDGMAFRNFTINEGLVNNRVLDIYEDKKGHIWFATEGGASYYDGESFNNYTTQQGLLNNDLNSIIEDESGNIWFASRGELSIYDGNTFKPLLKTDGVPFKNVRSLILDKKGQIWLAGEDGLWQFDGKVLTKYTSDFTGYVYQDRLGYIWTSSENPNQEGWQVKRWDKNSLFVNEFSSTQIWKTKGMIFGIIEDSNGEFWFGTLNGVCHYDGNQVNCLNESNDL